MFGISKLKKLHQRVAGLGLFGQRFAYLYGADRVTDVSEGSANVLQNAIGTNSAAFTKGDVVGLTSGYLVVAGANVRGVGIADTTVTMASDNQTVAKAEVPFLPASDNLRFDMDFNASATVADVGSYFQLTGATGAQQVNYSTKSATVGSVVLMKLDPRGEGSAVRGTFAFAKEFPNGSYTIAT